MSFNWLDFLKVAEELLESNEEGFLRSSISRSDYTIFGATRYHLENKRGISFPNHNIHKELINYLKKHNDRLYRKIGFLLNKLRKERVYADYNGGISIRKSDALKSYEWANNLRDLILAQLL